MASKCNKPSPVTDVRFFQDAPFSGDIFRGMRLPIRMGVIGLLLALFATSPGQQKPSRRMPTMKKLTPVIIVEQIEPCLPSWLDRLGLQKTAEVPEGDKLGFV